MDIDINSQFYVKVHKARVNDLNHLNGIFLQGGFEMNVLYV